jgi:hypothetical protein
MTFITHLEVALSKEHLLVKHHHPPHIHAGQYINSKKHLENIAITETSIGTKIAITLPLLLFVLSIIIFLQQIPMIAYNNTKIYDKDFVTVLKEIGNHVPEGSSIIASANVPS